MTAQKPVALVTGASSGIGKASAEALVKAGYTVYGTSRRRLPDSPAGVRMRVMDVTDPASVQSCVQGILVESERIDLLLNNAGYYVEGFLEEVPVSAAQQLFDVDFFGVVHVTNAVLPAMRARKSGKIIMMSSLLGLVGMGLLGYMCAAKYALEGYSEALRSEVKPFGVSVALVEPSYVKTGSIERAPAVSGVKRIADYDARRTQFHSANQRDIAAADEPALVAQQVLRIAQAARPRLRHTVGRQAGFIARLKRYLPEALFFGVTEARLAGR